jgi:hypothetical protein
VIFVRRNSHASLTGLGNEKDFDDWLNKALGTRYNSNEPSGLQRKTENVRISDDFVCAPGDFNESEARTTRAAMHEGSFPHIFTCTRETQRKGRRVAFDGFLKGLCACARDFL